MAGATPGVLRPFVRPFRRSVLGLGALLVAAVALRAGESDGRLDIYWVDVEGGAATLIVTPAGESILVDTGLPGERDPGRIHHLATRIAKLERIDHLVVTHFDRDHFGGTADLLEKIPVGRVYDPGFPGNHPFDRRTGELLERYRAATRGKRWVLRPGETIPLRQPEGPVRQTEGAPRLSIRCLAAKQHFVTPRGGQVGGELCGEIDARDPDRSENRNSIVLLVTLGEFDLLDAADLTWNLERQLVCPVNLVGTVDVYQADHHGLDSSNNPVLVRRIEPRVAVVNNGPRKGCMPNTFRTLEACPSIRAIYQLHRNLRSKESNTVAERIANEEADCKAAYIKLSVDPRGESYTVTVPSKGHQQTYETK